MHEGISKILSLKLDKPINKENSQNQDQTN